MCGITGFNWEDRNLIRKMTQVIAHRGPDGEGYFTDQGISLGHRRLSIIDLSEKGKQPMFNEDNTIVLVFNGEIYNFKELKKEIQKRWSTFKSNSDTEVIINGYEVFGENIFSKLDGMFAIGLCDKKNQKLLIARDRIGKKPLYYSQQKDKLLFASEIKSLLQAGISRKTDSLIESSVEKRLISDVPIGVLLSGGLDSSTIVSYMKRKTGKIKTFSVGFTEGMDESKYARIVADYFNTDHKEIILNKEILSSLPKVVWSLDEPISDPAALPTYLLSKEVSKYVKVVL